MTGPVDLTHRLVKGMPEREIYQTIGPINVVNWLIEALGKREFHKGGRTDDAINRVVERMPEVKLPQCCPKRYCPIDGLVEHISQYQLAGECMQHASTNTFVERTP